eukprot:5629096-Pleurochrysis_carterae.AAC.2
MVYNIELQPFNVAIDDRNRLLDAKAAGRRGGASTRGVNSQNAVSQAVSHLHKYVYQPCRLALKRGTASCFAPASGSQSTFFLLTCHKRSGRLRLCSASTLP